MADDKHVKIQLRRSALSFDSEKIKGEKPVDGEPIFINSKYLVIGQDNKAADTLLRFKAFNANMVDKQVFVNINTKQDADTLYDEKGNQILPITDASRVKLSSSKFPNIKTTDAALNNLADSMSSFDSRIKANATSITNLTTTVNSNTSRIGALETKTNSMQTNISTLQGSVNTLTSNQTVQSTNKKIYVLGTESTSGQTKLKYNSSVYINTSGQLKGAAWNDFAEYRLCYDEYVEPGDVICEFDDGVMERSIKRLQPGAAVVTDTYGVVIGPEKPEYVPVAVAGRVLVKAPYDEKFKVGDPVCAGEYGMISKMSRLETILFPDRILGYVSEIPTYDKWNDVVEVRGRIWIKVK